MAIIKITVSNSFDGTTSLVAANMLLTQLSGDVWELTDGSGDPFVDIGVFPFALLDKALASFNNYVKTASLETVAAISSFSMQTQVTAGGETAAMSDLLVTNPASSTRLGGLLLSDDLSLVLTTAGDTGDQTIFLEVFGVDLEKIDGQLMVNLLESNSSIVINNNSGPIPINTTPIIGAGSNDLDEITLYDGSLAFTIDVPVATADQELATIEVGGGGEDVTLAPGGGQMIESPSAGTVGATAVLSTASESHRWQFDAVADTWWLLY